MNLRELKNLLLLTGIVLGIQLKGQITLSNQEYDLYAKALVSESALKSDTAVLRSQLRDCDELDKTRTKQLNNLGFEIGQHEQNEINLRLNYNTLEGKFQKKEKAVIRLRKVVLTLSVFTILEAGAVYFLVR